VPTYEFTNEAEFVVEAKVARFFLTKYTKTGEKWPHNIRNGRKIVQITLKYTKFFHSNALQNLPKFGIFV
jgi:hypothetical protein